jgi:hypothetical protein
MLLLFVLVSVGGCAGKSPDRAKEISHVRALTTLYFRAASTLGKNPANEQEFKDVIAKDKPDLKVLGVSSSDELFTSDRDGQPIVILYGAAQKGGPGGVVAYEQNGKEGKRLVGFKNGQVEEIDDARFAKLVPSSTKG